MAHRHALLFLLFLSVSMSQTLDNRSLNGKYFFRHIQLTVTDQTVIQSSRSLSGSATFDGAGAFSFSGQQVIGAAGPTTLAGSGTYSVQANGIVSVSNPQQTALNMNARLGQGALIASTTDAGANIYDLLIAIPAPTGGSAGLSGSYWVSSLDFQNASATSARDAFFKVTATSGAFGAISVSGQAANLGSQTINQTISGATYTVSNDGSGTANFPIAGGGASAGQLVSGAKTLYVSQDGNYFLAGAGQDLMIGVKALSPTASNASLKDLYFTGSLRLERDFNASAGAANSGGVGKLVVSKRVRTSGGAVDFTAVNSYAVNADGSGSGPELNSFALGSGAFVGSGTAVAATGVYELYFGIRAPAVGGSGVFLNPLGIVNAASFAPSGASISPGEFVTLFGSGLAGKTDVATGTSYTTPLSGVEVTFNNVKAPVYAISATQISVLVPLSVSGPTATVVVSNSGVRSNSVIVPVAKTSPGIFTVPSAGIGPAAVLHADFSLVNAAKPARVGETILIFLTGLGAVTPVVADGAPPNILTDTLAAVNVYFGGVMAKPLYKGLSPQFPGLYQVNVTVPLGTPTGSAISLAIETPDAFHDQVDISIN